MEGACVFDSATFDGSTEGCTVAVGVYLAGVTCSRYCRSSGSSFLVGSSLLGLPQNHPIGPGNCRAIVCGRRRNQLITYNIKAVKRRRQTGIWLFSKVLFGFGDMVRRLI